MEEAMEVAMEVAHGGDVHVMVGITALLDGPLEVGGAQEVVGGALVAPGGHQEAQGQLQVSLVAFSNWYM